MGLSIRQRFVNKVTAKLPWMSKKAVMPLAAVLVALPAVSALAFSYGPMVSVQPESGTRSGGASVVADANASGGQSLKFGSAANVSCSNPQHEPGGPDGMNGCWPNEDNTGVPDDITLTNYTGSCNITTANTVIDSKILNCEVYVRAANVTIRNSQINGRVVLDYDDCDEDWSYTITDSRVHLGDKNYRGLMFCNYVATRVNVSGGQSMAFCMDCTIQDSYLHGPLEDPEGAAANQASHNSTVRVSSGALIKHNTLWCEVVEYPQPNGQDTSGCSANQTAYSHDGVPPANSTIEANLYMPTSGGFCAYGGSTGGAGANQVNNIVFKDNIFKRRPQPGDGGRRECGYYGTITGYDSSRPGNQWINNRYDDGTVINGSM